MQAGEQRRPLRNQKMEKQTEIKEIRAGIIGIGNMGSAHAATIGSGKIRGMRLAAVCDIRPERLAWAKEHLSCRAEEQSPEPARKPEGDPEPADAGAASASGVVALYTDYRELLDSGVVDCVIIAVPHSLHPVIAKEAFKRGLHVLTEKPAGIDVRSVREMNEAAAASGKVFGIMYNQRTNPLFAELKARVADGTLGDIKRFVWIINNWYRTQFYYDSGAWRATWNGEGGGVLLNQCPHNLDIWQWIMGMPKRVRAFCHEARYHDIHVEDDATIYAEYENGATAVFVTSTGEYPGTNRIEVSGTRGKAVLEDGRLKLFLTARDEREICRDAKEAFHEEPLTVRETVQTEPDSAHPGILQNFTDAVLYGTPLLAPGEEGINGLAISNAAYLSSWTDDWAELPLDEEKFLKLLGERQQAERENGGKKGLPAAGSETDGGYNKRWSVRW